jgi:HlyD family secretion protein
LEQPLYLVLYLPAKVGQRVRTGMSAAITPASVTQEQYGHLQGIVDSVAPFPSSKVGMRRLIQNPSLVDTFFASADGTPLELDVRLLPDSQAPSGYQWSSSRGPNTEITSGTLASVEVTLAEQKPLSLVLPILQ